MGAQDEGRTTRIGLGRGGPAVGRPPGTPVRAARRDAAPDDRARTSVIRFARPGSGRDPVRPVTGREQARRPLPVADGRSATRWLRYAEPGAAGAPVFVDGSGRRRTFWRVMGALVAVACLVFLAVLVAAAVAGSPGVRSFPTTTSAPGAVGAPAPASAP